MQTNPDCCSFTNLGPITRSSTFCCSRKMAPLPGQQAGWKLVHKIADHPIARQRLTNRVGELLDLPIDGGHGECWAFESEGFDGLP
jgi:hypothetical protein